jgi:hypothetical protein
MVELKIIDVIAQFTYMHDLDNTGDFEEDH